MSKIELVMPKMGESIIEATILGWKKKVGDRVEQDETVLDIATDKVDSEVPSPVSGVIAEIFYQENDVVPIGTVIAVIMTEADASVQASPTLVEPPVATPASPNGQAIVAEKVDTSPPLIPSASPNPELVAAAMPLTETVLATPKIGETARFYSPLVRTIAKQEGISVVELEAIVGSGNGGRVTKSDILDFVAQKKNAPAPVSSPSIATQTPPSVSQAPSTPTLKTSAPVSGNVEIIEMDRMRQLIAKHMVESKQTSPHVTSFVEVDVTNMVNWRNKVKADFQKHYGENITYTPLFIEAICRALREFPLVNSSIQGNQVLVKKDLNIGMAAALPTGNLIVPVIKNADLLNLAGLTKAVNDLANRARLNQLKPDEIQGGTFTLTNVGNFGNIMGTPIINQPQVAILAAGTIKKKPAVVETEFGDVIAIRHIMYLSMSYDHRIVDGAMGGTFLRRVGDYLEQFDTKRSI
jgi:2-oxoglutarate dehydrogenase E2 component (dihydrolipoamide succinyltransferase)